jgi:general stress protein 26
MTPEQRDQIVAIMNAASDLTIATTRADGYPQATTVSFASDGLALYFGTWTKSQKAQNLARDNRVSVVVDLPYQRWDEIKGLSLGGRATAVTAPDELAKVGALMLAKFPEIGHFVKLDQPAEMAVFRVDAEVFSILDYTQGFGHTEEVVP